MILVGVTGFPFSGKTKLMELVAKSTGLERAEERMIVKVPDKRLDRLAEIYSSRKKTPVEIEFLEAGSLDPKEGRVNPQTFSKLQEVDVILIVLRAFDNPAAPFIEGYESPLSQLEKILELFRERDLNVLRGRIERLSSMKRKLTNIEEIEKKFLEKVLSHMEEKGDLRGFEMKEDERKILSTFSLMTEKPKVALVNLGESKDYYGKDELKRLCEKNSIEILELPVGLAVEISELDEEDRKVFMEEYGLEEIDLEPLMREVMKAANLITFYTAGEKEARAWELREGSSIVEAAGTIHSDMARGFIRAEVFSYDDLIEYGSEKALKEHGLIKVVGRDYIVKDGDVVYIRFNV